MTRAEDLLKALNGLRNAADNELSGEAHDVALQHIKGLFRLADFDGEDTGEGANEASVPFAQAIAEVRTQAEGEMSGNAFYLASKSLDDLANLPSSPVSAPQEHAPVTEPGPQFSEPVSETPAESPRAEVAPAEPSLRAATLSSSPVSAPQEHAPEPVTEPAPQFSEPVSQTPPESPRAEAAPAGPSFDELAAASKARVEEAAASLGLEVVHHQELTLQEYHEALELEKRSSEPCSMPEIEPLAEEVPPPPVPGPEAPAVVDVIEAASAREVAEATHDFGIPAAVAGPVPEYAAPHEEPAPQAEAPVEFKPEPVVAAEPAPVPAPEPSPAPSVIVTKAEPRQAAPAPDAPPVEAVKKTDVAPKQPQKEPEKSFFSLWLDMVFGRRK